MLSLTVVERLLRSQHDFGEAVLVIFLNPTRAYTRSSDPGRG